MKIGVICSSGGSAFFTALEILLAEGLYSKSDFFVITDRPCEAENKCLTQKITYQRVVEPSNIKFSCKTKEIFYEASCDLILLFFSRLVSDHLFNEIATLNIHPSNLPAFRGFEAIKQARQSGVRFLGATLHIVSTQPDAGEIIAQVISPMSLEMNESEISRISFLQKTYLTLCAIDLTNHGIFKLELDKQRVVWNKPTRATWSACPALHSKKYIRAFNKLQKSYGVKVLVP